MSSVQNACSLQIMYSMLKGSYTGMVELLWKITNISSCFHAGMHALVFLFFINSVNFFLSYFFEFIAVYED